MSEIIDKGENLVVIGKFPKLENYDQIKDRLGAFEAVVEIPAEVVHEWLAKRKQDK